MLLVAVFPPPKVEMNVGVLRDDFLSPGGGDDHDDDDDDDDDDCDDDAALLGE